MDQETQQRSQGSGIPGEMNISAFIEAIRKAGRRPENIYANNFHFEPSLWDLRILLGQLEQSTGTSEVDWHTALSIPWLQVKLVAYYLLVQAAWYEIQNGPLKIPSYVMPAKPTPPPEDVATDPNSVAWYEAAKKIYDDMFPS